MRKAIDIIIDAKDGKMPSHEECYYTLLALASNSHFLERSLIEIEEAFLSSDKKGVFVSKMQANGIRKRQKQFRDQDPLLYLGAWHDPLNESGKPFREMADRIFKKIINREK